ncbi:helix-turn-helix domain-containing protein [Methylomonas rapida]|uniref:Uncharacterized protein n=1 Tax=Methylomonas rapida TaxID=2963939 RepID=A0ABY7GR03_9GAMM|nr:hypothetical protein [Methylomonas rapida]WAR46937.1 hypothetical protein NM686_010620 [Methylomonas rapida]
MKSTKKEERERLANAVGSSVAYFYQVAGGHRKPSASLCVLLEQHSNGLLTKEELRPEFFGPTNHKPFLHGNSLSPMADKRN